VIEIKPNFILNGRVCGIEARTWEIDAGERLATHKHVIDHATFIWPGSEVEVHQEENGIEHEPWHVIGPQLIPMKKGINHTFIAITDSRGTCLFAGESGNAE